MALFTGVQHLCTFNIVAPLFITFRQMFGRHHTPSSRSSLLMFHIDHPKAWVSSSLVLCNVAMHRCHIAQWHDGLWHSGKAGMPFRTTSLQDDPTWITTQFNSCFPIGCWSSMDLAWVSNKSLSKSQNCASHSAQHSGLPQTCSALDISWYFRGATMAPLCSCTGLVGQVPLEGNYFLELIITMDEPNLKHQSNKWKHSVLLVQS